MSSVKAGITREGSPLARPVLYQVPTRSTCVVELLRLSFSHIRSFTVCDPTSLGAPLRSSLESPAERRRSACAAWASKAPGGADEASLDLHDLTSLCAARAASAACSLADVGVVEHQPGV